MRVITIPLGMIRTNCYVVVAENNVDCLVIDPAFSHGKLSDYLINNNYNVIAVLLTHGHFDHCGGVAEIVSGKNIPVYCKDDDVKMASEASKNHWKAHALDCYVTNPITTEDTFQIKSFSVGVMFTPGHTPGSVCYFLGDYMFSGDTLFCGDIGRTDLDGGCSKSIKNSLQKIAKIQKDYYVLPGHEEDTTLSHEKQYNPYLKDLL